jgi:hypothetical protein
MRGRQIYHVNWREIAIMWDKFTTNYGQNNFLILKLTNPFSSMTKQLLYENHQYLKDFSNKKIKKFNNAINWAKKCNK